MHAFEMTIDGVANGEISQGKKKVVPNEHHGCLRILIAEIEKY